MARGTVVNETPTTQAQSKAWDEGYKATNLGRSAASKERGVFLFRNGRLVRPWEVEVDVTQEARFAPVMLDRYMENVATVDGEDIGSRQRRKAYMRRNDLADADEAHQQGAADRKRNEVETKKHRREALTRELERIVLMPQARHDRELKQRQAERLKRGEQGL